MKSVFQVAYSQKGKSTDAGGKGNLQVSVAQTMARLQGQNLDLGYKKNSSQGGASVSKKSLMTRSIEDDDEY